MSPRLSGGGLAACRDLPSRGARWIAWALALWLAAPSPDRVWGLEAENATIMRVSVAKIDNSARAHLERANAFLSNGQHAEAIDTVRRVMDANAGALIAVTEAGREARGGFVRYIPLRQYCQQWLAALGDVAPAALRQYRAQVDPLAEQWLKQADSEREQRWLQRIADEFFVSSVGDQAMLRLGSWALERGDYRRARECWEQMSPVLRFPASSVPRLAPYAGHSLWRLLREVDLSAQWDAIGPALRTHEGRGPVLAYPDTEVPLPELRARLALASILEGDVARAGLEIELLGRLHPDAAGAIGGRSGKYVALLETLLRENSAAPPPRADLGWPTFAGSAARNGVAAAPVDVAGKPLWRIELPRFESHAADGDHARIGESDDALLCCFPTVVGQTVVVNTGIATVDFEAIDLATGRVIFPRGNDPAAIAALRAILPRAAGTPRFTTTAADGRVYARIGSPITGSKTSEPSHWEPRGRLVALDLRAERRLALEIALEGPEWSGSWAFEGSPLVDHGRLFVALRRRDSVRAECHVACFDAQQGRLIWRRFLCAAETLREPRPHEITHTLLSLDQGTIFCNTNLGAVAALRSSTGELEWLTTYPRAAARPSDAEGGAYCLQRDLNPCVVHRDFVFVAPADCGAIIALDASTGQLLWRTSPGQCADVVHLLGVGRDRLLASGDCLHWLDIYTGRSLGQFPRAASAPPGHARANPRGWGRGLLAGSYVYWPTRDTIFVLRQDTESTGDGWQPILVREIPLGPRGAAGGNLVVAGGVLLIAAADRLYAFNELGREDHVGTGRRPGRATAERSVSANHR